MGTLLSLARSSQAFAERDIIPSTVNVQAIQTGGHIIHDMRTMSSFAPISTSIVEVNPETASASIDHKLSSILGHHVSEPDIAEAFTDWASTVTATTTVTTLTTTITVPLPTSEIISSSTKFDNVGGRAEPVVRGVVAAIGLAWAAAMI